MTVQIRQNNKALRVSAYAGFVDRHVQMVKFQAEHAGVISKIDEYDNMSEEDRAINVAYLSGMLRNGDALHYQWQQGLLDDGRFRSAIVAVADSIVSNPAGQCIWIDFKGRYNRDYRSQVEAMLERWKETA